MLSERTIKIVGRVTTAGVLESGCPIENLWSFLYGECRVSPIIIRILSVDEFVRDIDLDTSEQIDKLGESTEIDTEIMIHFFSCDFTELVSQSTHCLCWRFLCEDTTHIYLINLPVTLEWIFYIEISREREHRDGLGFWME